ncbi:PACE efflux transporter [Marinobacterium arenosum]|uniref:PACE efflux transporter n=1 Tax=Marinobacterium arenosum TaxID=2862496 RepID=UPI0021055774|nr:PACE efflux transporter [Marinobacterium arenosum]
MRTTADRIRHTIGFELLGLALLTPLASWLFHQDMVDIGPLALFFTFLGAGWNYLFNLLFDRLMLRWRGTLHKRPVDRLVHALSFELGLLWLTLPLIAWWLEVSLWQALLMDLSMVVFYLVFAYLYNWLYDALFPLPEAGVT